MKREVFTLAAASFLAMPADAKGNRPMTTSSLLDELHAKRASAVTLVVRHVPTYVTTLTTITPDKLARDTPVATVHDKAVIAAAFDHIARAEPSPHDDEREMRWLLTFEDAAGKAVAVVAASIGRPRLGTIDGHRVAFRGGELEHWLTATFAPKEAGATD